MTIQEKIDFFFAPPIPIQTGPEVSTLHLCRREIQDCLIGDVVAEADLIAAWPPCHRLFASTMVMMSGIDLLAKFYGGSDANSQTGARIQMFAEKFLFNGNAQFAEVLYYGCRNPMLHSFTLHQAKYTMSLVDALPTAAIWRATSAHSPNHFVISVKGLFTAFAGTVHAFEAAVRSDATLQEKFERMFPNDGSIAMWSAVLEPASVNVTDNSQHR